jgi:hypothetical protein
MAEDAGEIDFCTLGMFIIGLLPLFTATSPNR